MWPAWSGWVMPMYVHRNSLIFLRPHVWAKEKRSCLSFGMWGQYWCRFVFSCCDCERLLLLDEYMMCSCRRDSCFLSDYSCSKYTMISTFFFVNFLYSDAAIMNCVQYLPSTGLGSGGRLPVVIELLFLHKQFCDCYDTAVL